MRTENIILLGGLGLGGFLLYNSMQRQSEQQQMYAMQMQMQQRTNTNSGGLNLGSLSSIIEMFL